MVSSWYRTSRPVTVVIVQLMKTAKVHREGRGPYTMRHVFRTIADEALDRVAIDLIMGHSDPSMGGHYRERIDDARLVAVAEHVRAWLFGKMPDDGTTDDESDENPGVEQATSNMPQIENDSLRLKLYAG